MGTAGKIAGVAGILFFLLSMLVTLFFGFHTFIDPRGAISGDEAAPGFGAGCCCAFMSFAIAAGGFGAAYAAGRKEEDASG